MIENPVFNQQSFTELNLIGFLLFLVIGGYSFLFSCAINDEKRALGAAAGLTVIFFGLNLVSKLSEDLSWIENITLFSLFNPQAIIRGAAALLPISTGLLMGALLLFGLSVVTFKNRDLPL
ncbi:hypothetical protein [Bacillus sp. T33-2]|uniref:hypothetical protein n=1 Tax=Bacillus sp. T33-2 TaxID=2054168 RepID=UPI000C75FDEA|nr:hypothetical protein [Bacillus sp. T33-2]PLR95045.1 hypothetical protein CVD19_15390 [Bacillus sp. T33-2]